jgi:uncharacterized membrane protein (UPF0127 family)
MRVINRTRQTLLVAHGQLASTPWSRLVGLLGRRAFEPGDGLLLRGEQAIHTFGMFFAIDVAFLDCDGRVLRGLEGLAPQRVGPFVRGARNVLELPVGTLAATHTREGDKLDIQVAS